MFENKDLLIDMYILIKSLIDVFDAQAASSRDLDDNSCRQIDFIVMRIRDRIPEFKENVVDKLIETLIDLKGFVECQKKS